MKKMSHLGYFPVFSFSLIFFFPSLRLFSNLLNISDCAVKLLICTADFKTCWINTFIMTSITDSLYCSEVEGPSNSDFRPYLYPQFQIDGSNITIFLMRYHNVSV